MRRFYVYIVASKSRRLYVGVTNDLFRRVHEHRMATSGFAARYRTERLVYFEIVDRCIPAITREKQIKGWLRARKIELIERDNPTWNDLSSNW